MTEKKKGKDMVKVIEEIEDILSKDKENKVKAETTLSNLSSQLEDIDKELVDLGIDPEKVEEEVASLKKEAQDYLKKLSELSSRIKGVVDDAGYSE